MEKKRLPVWALIALVIGVALAGCDDPQKRKLPNEQKVAKGTEEPDAPPPTTPNPEKSPSSKKKDDPQSQRVKPTPTPTPRPLRSPQDVITIYHLTFHTTAGEQNIGGVEVTVTLKKGTGGTGVTSQNGETNITVRGQLGGDYRILANHPIYFVPGISARKLELDKNPEPIEIRIPSISLKIETSTIDRKGQAEPVTLSIRAQDGQTELKQLKTTLNQMVSTTIPKPQNELVVIGITDKLSRYSQGEPIRQSTDSPSPIQIQIQFGLGEKVEIQIACKDGSGRFLSNARLEANGEPFQEGETGRYLYTGYAREGKTISVIATKEAYVFKHQKGDSLFDQLPNFMVETKDNKFSAELSGLLKPVTIKLKTATNQTAEPVSATFELNHNGQVKSTTTNNTGIARFKKLDIGIGEEIRLAVKVNAVGIEEKPIWPSNSNILKTTAKRDYDLTVKFHRLPKFLLTLLDAKTDAPLAKAQIMKDKELFGLTNSNGVFEGYYPQRSGNFSAQLVRSGYLTEDFTVQVSGNSGSKPLMRYLLAISPPKYEIGLEPEILFNVAYDSPIKDNQSMFEKRIRNALKTGFQQASSLIWTDDLPSENFMAKTTIDELTADRVNLSVDIKDSSEENQLIASALIENVDLRNVTSVIQTQVMPQILASLPVVGYVIREKPVTINVGTHQFVNQGDQFKISAVNRDPQGKLTTSKEIKGKIKVTSVKPTEAKLDLLFSEQISVGSRAERQPADDRPFVLANQQVGTKVYWRKQGETQWNFAGSVGASGTLEFQTSSDAIDVLRRTAYGESIESYPPGSRPRREAPPPPEATMYTLIFDTVPDSEIQLSGTRLGAKKSANKKSGEEWFVPTGAYQAVAIAPSDEYINQKSFGQIPILEGRQWEGSESASMYGNIVRVNLRLGIDWRKRVSNAEADELSDQEIIGLLNQAIEELENQNSTHQPNYRYFLRKMAQYLMENDRLTEAIEIYQKVLRVNHRDPMTYYGLGVVYSEIGDHSEAINQFEEALKYLGHIKSEAASLNLEYNLRYQIILNKHKEGESTVAVWTRFEDLYNRLEKEFSSLSGGVEVYQQEESNFESKFLYLQDLLGK